MSLELLLLQPYLCHKKGDYYIDTDVPIYLKFKKYCLENKKLHDLLAAASFSDWITFCDFIGGYVDLAAVLPPSFRKKTNARNFTYCMAEWYRYYNELIAPTSVVFATHERCGLGLAFRSPQNVQDGLPLVRDQLAGHLYVISLPLYNVLCERGYPSLFLAKVFCVFSL